MGWGDFAKEIGKQAATQAAAGLAHGAASGVAAAAVDEHGDKVGKILTAVDSGIVTAEQANRIEQKLDEHGAKLDGITAQIAELRHLIKGTSDG